MPGYRILILVLVMGCFPLLEGCSFLAFSGPAPADPLEMTPEEVVESFYSWILDYPGNVTADRTFRDSPYLSASFVEQIEAELSAFQGGGADRFWCAQDIPNSYQVEKAQIDGDSASTRVTTSFSGHAFTVLLARQGEEWLITNVRCR
jgi:hypothetical protein